MTTNTIKLSQFYALAFSGAKTLVTQINWDRVPGKNKLRKFFLRNNWQADIVSVSISSSGAKGGVFFLEVDTLTKKALKDEIGNDAKAQQVWDQLIKDGLITPQGIKTVQGKAGQLPAQVLVYQNNRQKIINVLTRQTAHRQFVVKGTDEPGRVLFAEYVLSRVGKAKIPKSLVLRVDPTRPHNHANPSEGMVMLNLLSTPAKRNQNVNPQAYANSYAFLDDGQGTINSCATYLVVQKLIAGDTMSSFSDINADILDLLVKQKLKIVEQSFFSDNAFRAMPAKDATELILLLQKLGCMTKGGIVDPQYQAILDRVAKLSNVVADVTRILGALSTAPTTSASTATTVTSIAVPTKVSQQTFLSDNAFQATPATDVADLVTLLKKLSVITSSDDVDPNYQQTLSSVTKFSPMLADIARILKASGDVLTSAGLQFTKDSVNGQFDELEAAMQQAPDSPLRRAFLKLREQQTEDMERVEEIVGNAEMMYNTGRILFADLPIGNGDRFENMNTGNFFFVDKTTTVPGKVNYPIGCIDNDAFLHTYLPKRTAPVVEGFSSEDDYVESLLQFGAPELWGANQAPPEGYTRAPSAAVVQMMNVGKWFDQMFSGCILSPTMPICVLKLLGPTLYDPSEVYAAGVAIPYKKSKQLAGWVAAKQKIQRGFCEALLEFQEIPLFEFRHVYAALAGTYGKGINFDFRAFEVRHRYLAAVAVDKTNWTVVIPNFNTITGAIAADVGKTICGISISDRILKALMSGEGAAVLQNAGVTEELIRKLLLTLSIADQEALIPCPFGAIIEAKRWIPFSELQADRKQAILANWDALDQKYRRRINAVICAILVQLVDDYDHETRHFKFSYFFVNDSKAYFDAKKNAESFSYAKLYKDGGSRKTDALRRRLLTDFNLQAHL